MKANPFRQLRRGKQEEEWTLVPSSEQDIEALRHKCRRLVTRRATMSAGAAAVPIPGLDIAVDITLLMRVIDDINGEFGLSEAQIERLNPKARVLVYQTIVGVGGTLVGRAMTRELIGFVLKRAGMKTAAKQGAKLVPVAGQIASAAIGFTAFRMIGFQHIDACAKVAAELLHAKQ
ncbi:hypothetical protein G3574_09260 [Noviherbaspirillum sp. 17J57-3]|uniref:DUF697 domain-containing protein n=2 Tax=Noviherbaspirillum galbum TaxID=2709383 RepID=A0A6B3SR64_9BURK|nr:hypothetical protein [Noviherbaspirillum galbum]